ncbi:MAG: hypothetical protein EZS28_000944 [Streblomastix strix]|uniref:Uncharacterized protein n=1 Tax=Streblomastix strix TaxID=222440 RepID=A0A5J4XAJ3_9EUKA|nr:MAG: hypothetical protein EZS28_000944 [Streblomastix strix]
MILDSQLYVRRTLLAHFNHKAKLIFDTITAADASISLSPRGMKVINYDQVAQLHKKQVQTVKKHYAIVLNLVKQVDASIIQCREGIAEWKKLLPWTITEQPTPKISEESELNLEQQRFRVKASECKKAVIDFDY